MSKKTNCWGHMNCKVYENCPAYPNFGTICFSIPNTLCRGETQGRYAEKITECRKCDFYVNVLRSNNA